MTRLKIHKLRENAPVKLKNLKNVVTIRHFAHSHPPSKPFVTTASTASFDKLVNRFSLPPPLIVVLPYVELYKDHPTDYQIPETTHDAVLYF